MALQLSACAMMAPTPPQIVQLPPEVRVERVFPIIAADLLTCMGEVTVPEALTMPNAMDNDATRFNEQQRLAGADCRDKLSAIARLVATWPR